MDTSSISASCKHLCGQDVAILLVDGQVSQLRLMQQILSREGYRNLFLANSDQSAYSILERNADIGLIVVSESIPDKDPFECCRGYRA